MGLISLLLSLAWSRQGSKTWPPGTSLDEKHSYCRLLGFPSPLWGGMASVSEPGWGLRFVAKEEPHPASLGYRLRSATLPTRRRETRCSHVPPFSDSVFQQRRFKMSV